MSNDNCIEATHLSDEIPSKRFVSMLKLNPQIGEALSEHQFVTVMKILFRRGVPAVSAFDMEAELVTKIWVSTGNSGTSDRQICCRRAGNYEQP